MGNGNQPAEAARRLLQEWTSRLGEILESMAGSRPRVEWSLAPAGAEIAAQSAALGEKHGPVLWWEQSFSAAPNARFWLGAPEAAWSALGARILSAAGIEQADPAEIRATYLELAGQSLESLAHALGAQLGGEVTCSDRTERAEAPQVSTWFLLQLTFGDTTLAPMLAAPSEEMAGALLRDSHGADTPAGAVVPARPPEPASASQMLELLLDVELPVSVSFGRTHLPLKETLKLTTGSIVELNRMVTEPVEVIVNNCVIARGEVVVIDGNYGVRIREIMSREARLRHLR
jgi:flagellar motor switch protein FliN/FliY